jgi:hypothetical protein
MTSTSMMLGVDATLKRILKYDDQKTFYHRDLDKIRAANCAGFLPLVVFFMMIAYMIYS